jgi:hypothetical protein
MKYKYDEKELILEINNKIEYLEFIIFNDF